MAATDSNTFGYAAFDEAGILKPWKFTRRPVGPADVELDIHFCGMCHSDLHSVKNEWKNTTYPIVPGHEVTGVVTSVGAQVSSFKVGDRVGVGCLVASCKKCGPCDRHLENYCVKGCIFTYNSKHPEDETSPATYGGYSNRMVCHQDFVLHIPDSLPLDEAAPLLCAGITVYSPMMYYKLNMPGSTMGVIGLGGLGHMAVKVAKAMGLKVVVISTSASKQKEAVETLGADGFICSKDPQAMHAAAGTLDSIIDTVSAPHNLSPYAILLKFEGKLIMVGASPDPLPIDAYVLNFGRKTIAGSLIGGLKETQEMLEFCGQHKVLPLVEKIPIEYVNTANERMAKSDVRYRFVIDVKGSLKAE